MCTETGENQRGCQNYARCENITIFLGYIFDRIFSVVDGTGCTDNLNP